MQRLISYHRNGLQFYTATLCCIEVFYVPDADPQNKRLVSKKHAQVSHKPHKLAKISNNETGKPNQLAQLIRVLVSGTC